MTNLESPYIRPPPITIWDLLQLTLIVALFSAVIRGLINQHNGGTITFSLIVLADLIVFAALMIWVGIVGRAAQQSIGIVLASLAYTPAYRKMRSAAYYMTLAASFPYQSILLAFAANFQAMGPVIVGAALLTHAALAIVTMNYWRLSRHQGVCLSESGMLIHGSHFLSWSRLSTYRYSDVRSKLVLYERTHFRFRYHEMELPSDQAETVLSLIRPKLKLAL